MREFERGHVRGARTSIGVGSTIKTSPRIKRPKSNESVPGGQDCVLVHVWGNRQVRVSSILHYSSHR